MPSPHEQLTNTTSNRLPTGQRTIPDNIEKKTLREIETCIQKTNLKSAAGLDGINNLVLARLPEKANIISTEIFNEAYENGRFPEAWDEFIVYLMPKPGSGGLRPLSLAVCTLKLLEKVIARRVDWYLERNNILSRYQIERDALPWTASLY